jgi:hypothetical protein
LSIFEASYFCADTGTEGTFSAGFPTFSSDIKPFYKGHFGRYFQVKNFTKFGRKSQTLFQVFFGPKTLLVVGENTHLRHTLGYEKNPVKAGK